MELRQLRYVVAIADHGTFSRAAHTLHTVPLSLSRQVAALEAELDQACRWLTRSEQRVGRRPAA